MSARILRAGGKIQEQVPDALQSDHDLHTGQQVPRFALGHAGDSRGHTRIHFHVNRIEIFFALPDGIQPRHGSRGNSLGRDGGGLAG